jgi:transposase-like protein
MAEKKKKERRVFTDAQKREIVLEIGPLTVAAVARKHGLSDSVLYVWKAKHRGNGESNGHVASPPEVAASLDEALRQIEQAGQTIAAIRAAARKVFGI